MTKGKIEQQWGKTKECRRLFARRHVMPIAYYIYAYTLLYICLHLIIYMPMNFDIIPMIFEPKCLGFQKGLLLACKRVRFTLQKESFYTAKGLHLEGKRSPFEKAGENRLMPKTTFYHTPPVPSL